MKQNRSYKKTSAPKSTGTGRTVRQTRSRAVAGQTGGVSVKKANSTDDIQYVLPLGNGWVVKASKAQTFTAITDSKTEAISIARSLARTKHMKMVVHGRNGAVELRENYVV